MVPIIPEITHGFKIQGEKCLVKHIEDLAKRFLKTSLRPECENTQKGQIQVLDSSLVCFFS